MKKIIGIFICMMLLGTVNFSVLGTQEINLKNDIDSYIIDFMDNLNIPGLSAGIVKSNEIVWKNSYGYANLEENIKVENTTLFMLASISKTITGTAVMQLFEQDYFDLDDSINDYLPFQVNHPLYDTDITFKMLVTHTSSIQDNWDYIPFYEGDSPLSLGYYLEEYFTPGGEFYSADDNFRNRKPGTNFAYSNVGSALVGFLVEVMSDMSFEDYCQMYIFNPLNMYDTSWFLEGLNISNIAIPYEGDFEPHEHCGASFYPAGLLRTSTPQLCNFVISMLNNGTFESNSILSEDTVDIIFTPHFTNLPFGWGDMIGIFWFGDEVEDGVLNWGHGGSTTGVRTSCTIYPSDDLGVVVLTNGPGSNNINPLVSELYEYGKEITNKPPANPTVIYDKENNELVIKSVDPDDNKIRYGVSWENNQNIDYWTDYYNSSLEIRIDCQNHKNTVGVITEDEYGGQSEWISVTSKIKSYISPLQLFLDKLSHSFQIFEKILNQIK